MDIIQLLPDSVANQIAAGEVIQRPASVIKELVENSIDAGAKTIKVLVVDAGKTSIQVVDDGKGMSDTDARLSFERHATSKIRKPEDLFALHTMGFRGEALASIAAVAQVTLITRQASDDVGTELHISGSRIESQEPAACAAGSNFMIENLFYNVPARRRFLKSNSTEMSNITQAFERIVLVYPEISFTLCHNGQEVLSLPATTLKRRIVDLFGKRINEALLPVEANTTLCKITGFVGKPESAKKKGAHQYLFVNGRFMKHPYFHKAIMMAYDRLVPAGEQVPYFLYFDVDPENIDVNIHPVKTEIKFENEQAIWQIVQAAVRDAVGRFSSTTEIDFDTEGMPDIPTYNPNGDLGVTAPRIDFNPQYNPFSENKRSDAHSAHSGASGKSGGLLDTSGNSRGTSAFLGSSLGLGTGNRANTDNWQELYSGLEQKARSDANKAPEQEFFSSVINEAEEAKGSEFLERSEEMLQYCGKYIMLQCKGGILLVDQHRADVRVRFEDYMQQLKTRTAHVQPILFPEEVQFPPSYDNFLPVILTQMKEMGFGIEQGEGGKYVITGIPGGLDGLNPLTLVQDLVTAAVEYGSDVVDGVNSILATELAQKAATPYGEVLSLKEMTSLVDALFACDSYRYTPDGKAILALISDAEIHSKF